MLFVELLILMSVPEFAGTGTIRVSIGVFPDRSTWRHISRAIPPRDIPFPRLSVTLTALKTFNSRSMAPERDTLRGGKTSHQGANGGELEGILGRLLAKGVGSSVVREFTLVNDVCGTISVWWGCKRP